MEVRQVFFNVCCTHLDLASDRLSLHLVIAFITRRAALPYVPEQSGRPSGANAGNHRNLLCYLLKMPKQPGITVPKPDGEKQDFYAPLLAASGLSERSAVFKCLAMQPWGYWKILHGPNGRQELAERLVEHAVAIDVHERNGPVDLRDCKPAPPTGRRMCVDAGTQCSMTSADVLGEDRATKFMLSLTVQPTLQVEPVTASAVFDSTRTELSHSEVRLLVQIGALLHHPLMDPKVTGRNIEQEAELRDLSRAADTPPRNLCFRAIASGGVVWDNVHESYFTVSFVCSEMLARLSSSQPGPVQRFLAHLFGAHEVTRTIWNFCTAIQLATCVKDHLESRKRKREQAGLTGSFSDTEAEVAAQMLSADGYPVHVCDNINMHVVGETVRKVESSWSVPFIVQAWREISADQLTRDNVKDMPTDDHASHAQLSKLPGFGYNTRDVAKLAQRKLERLNIAINCARQVPTLAQCVTLLSQAGEQRDDGGEENGDDEVKEDQDHSTNRRVANVTVPVTLGGEEQNRGRPVDMKLIWQPVLSENLSAREVVQGLIDRKHATMRALIARAGPNAVVTKANILYMCTDGGPPLLATNDPSMLAPDRHAGDGDEHPLQVAFSSAVNWHAIKSSFGARPRVNLDRVSQRD